MRVAEPVTPPVGGHCESPFWDAHTGRLLWVDVFRCEVLALGPAGGLSRHRVPGRAATVLRRRAAGGFVIATGHAVIGADDSLSSFEPIAELTGDPAVRTNDGGCDPSGAFVVGTMAYDETPGAGAVFRLTPDGRVTDLVPRVSISNGVQWSPDGARVFYIDTPTRRVDQFDVDPETGAWSRRRVHIDLADAHGFPDGMAIDAEGGLWIAFWGGGCVGHYDSTGSLVESVQVPGVSQVSACAFGDDRMSTLYITTSRQGLPDAAEPGAGSVFAVPTGSQGASLHEFAG